MIRKYAARYHIGGRLSVAKKATDKNLQQLKNLNVPIYLSGHCRKISEVRET